MRNCANCHFYCAIDPAAGNCRVKGAGRDQLRAARPLGTCSSFMQIANDNQPVRKTG